MTSLRVAKTAAMVSSDVPTSCWFPAGNFCTRSRMAYFPVVVIMMGIRFGLRLSMNIVTKNNSSDHGRSYEC